MDNVSGGVMEPRYLFFYSVKEFLLLITAKLCVWVGGGGISPMPSKLAAAQRVRANFAVL